MCIMCVNSNHPIVDTTSSKENILSHFDTFFFFCADFIIADFIASQDWMENLFRHWKNETFFAQL